MLLSLFLTCFVALVVATLLLLVLGHRVHFSFWVLGVALTAAIAAGAGLAAEEWWSLPTRYVRGGQLLLVGFGIVVALARRVWNPIGQAFFATFLASATSYLVFGAYTTFSEGLSPGARVASAVLLLFELAALTLSASFTFESCDSVCRTRPSRRTPAPDPSYFPMVSLQMAVYNEPPDMLIDTIHSLEGIDYPNYEIVIIDNNTHDPEVWQPVEEYCRGRERVTFVHVDPWPGFKSGALNLALREHTHPDAEVIGIVDADYVIDPSWLRELAGYFATPSVAFVQTPQDYREYDGDAYLQACYDAYKYFFVTSMPSRHERNSIIFAGTMGLLRRSVLEEVGGWSEWCITEDAELSLRMLKQGYEGIYIAQSYGRGIMPLTFSALKSQRFRWCFGGMQILRMHWRDLLPWRHRDNRLTLPQKIDYFLGSVQWTNDLFYFGFTIVLLASAVVLLNEGPLGLRPLYGAAVLLPGALIASGVVRALWALRVKTGIGLKRAILAFVNWLSLSWTVAVACVQGLTRKEGVFMRTPKDESRNKLLAALWAARTETLWALALWTLAALVARDSKATPFVLALFAWQGVVYACGPYTSWLNQHTELSAQLERRRRTERLRERAAQLAPYYVGGFAGATAAAAIAIVIAVGGSNPGEPKDPFATPSRTVDGQPSESDTPDGEQSPSTSTPGADQPTGTTDTPSTTDGSSTSTTAPPSSTTGTTATTAP